MKFIGRYNKFITFTGIFICALLGIYFLFSIYFVKHVYFGSKINSIDVSGKTVEQINAEMKLELNSYSLNIKERGNKKEKINTNDINLGYKSEEQFKELKDMQNPFEWPSLFFSKKNSHIEVEILYDKDQLTKKINNLSCVTDKSIIDPKEPSFKYISNKNNFAIINEIKGNKIDRDILAKSIEDAVSKQQSTIDLQSASCYINPKYNSKSKEVIKTRDMLNKYVSSKITYNFEKNKEILDGSAINKWLTADNNFNVILDKSKVKEYVKSLANKYNTAGKTRSFHTSSGSTINISGGDYGKEINLDKEVENLSGIIKEGGKIAREPVYIQTAGTKVSDDIGNTYVEIDMSKQHLWFYKNGSLVVEGNVVTGNVSLNDTTPAGVYRLKDKERNAVLRGQGYSAPVNYWMPFNGGIGIHDASWRSVFGGQIYKTNGSHGCVNSPYNLAQTIFNNIDVGTPIVCYY